MNLDTLIAPFERKYRNSVRKLFSETAFMGLPLEKGFCDKEVYTDIETKYYTDYEAESCFVALKNKQFIGYLIGCKNQKRYDLLNPIICAPAALVGLYKFLTRKYDKKTSQLIRWFFKEGHNQIPAIPNNAAHFHINLEKTCRTKGIGSKLVETFEAEIKQTEIKKCFVQVLYTGKLGALPFFIKKGYEEFDSKKFTGLKQFLEDDVTLYTLVKEIK